jgi:hypothetical protein
MSKLLSLRFWFSPLSPSSFSLSLVLLRHRSRDLALLLTSCFSLLASCFFFFYSNNSKPTSGGMKKLSSFFGDEKDKPKGSKKLAAMMGDDISQAVVKVRKGSLFLFFFLCLNMNCQLTVPLSSFFFLASLHLSDKNFEARKSCLSQGFQIPPTTFASDIASVFQAHATMPVCFASLRFPFSLRHLLNFLLCRMFGFQFTMMMKRRTPNRAVSTPR